VVLVIRTAPPDKLRLYMRARAIKAGETIAEKRKPLGPTEFSALIGVGLQTLHKIEHGQIVPRDHLKAAIALALDIDLDELYGWPTNDEIAKAVAA